VFEKKRDARSFEAVSILHLDRCLTSSGCSRVLPSLRPSLNHKYPQMKHVLNFAGYGSGTGDAFGDPQENFTAFTHTVLNAGETVAHIFESPKRA
jgi:hypothetical protein